MNKDKALLIILILSFIFKQLAWTAFVPMWHFPDEQAHFGQVAYIAEKGSTPPGDNSNNLTEEIRKSEELLGTERDFLGINKFTYHPEYRIEYAVTMLGKYEKEIIELSKDPLKREMVKREATRYPEAYYRLTAFIYKSFYQADLFQRVYLTRFAQLTFSLGTVILSYFIGRLLFQNSSLLSLSLAAFVSFQPMFSFVSAGINSDNIANFIFTLFLYLSVKLIKEKLNYKLPAIFFPVMLLTVYQKPHFVLVIPLAVTVSIYVFRRHIFMLLMSAGFFSLAFYFLSAIKIIPLGIAERIYNNGFLKNFPQYFMSYALPHLYREVMPWYWGVFDWLGITYPRIVHRIINWLVLVAIIGLIWGILKRLLDLPKRKMKQMVFTLPVMLFMILTGIVYVSGVYLYDWIEWYKKNIHLGVQGRYFFPLITVISYFLLLGFTFIFSAKKKLIETGIKIMVSLMVVLHNYAFLLVLKSYYQLNFRLLIIQASQYKPWFFKGWLLTAILLLSLTSMTFFLIKYWLTDLPYEKGLQKNR